MSVVSIRYTYGTGSSITTFGTRMFTRYANIYFVIVVSIFTSTVRFRFSVGSGSTYITVIRSCTTFFTFNVTFMTF